MNRKFTIVGIVLILYALILSGIVVLNASRAYGHEGWDAVAECESNQRWGYDGYHKGGLQFLPSTWDYAARDYAGRPDLVGVNPAQTSRETQIEVAEALRIAEGIGHWPYCGRFWFPDPNWEVDEVARFLAAVEADPVAWYLHTLWLETQEYLHALWEAEVEEAEVEGG